LEEKASDNQGSQLEQRGNNLSSKGMIGIGPLKERFNKDRDILGRVLISNAIKKYKH
jgi:hypothetical protein